VEHQRPFFQPSVLRRLSVEAHLKDSDAQIDLYSHVCVNERKEAHKEIRVEQMKFTSNNQVP